MASTSPYGRLIAWTGVLFVVCLILVAMTGSRSLAEGVDLRFGPSVAVVEIEGTILSSESTVRVIESFASRSEVKGLLLKIESPGGGVVASDEIYRAVRRARDEEGKPVVAYLGSVGASGGYYIACAADSIIAHPASTTGSIGVILQYAVTEEMFRKLGIEWETVTTGPYKDMGSPFESASERHREWFQTVIEDDYEQFLDVIRAGRDIEEEQLRRYADGRIFTGRQAVAWGFADRNGDFYDAIAMVGEMAGLGDDPRLVRARRRRQLTIWDFVFGRAGLVELRRELGLGPVDAPHVYYLMR